MYKAKRLGERSKRQVRLVFTQENPSGNYSYLFKLTNYRATKFHWNVLTIGPVGNISLKYPRLCEKIIQRINTICVRLLLEPLTKILTIVSRSNLDPSFAQIRKRFPRHNSMLYRVYT